jgi:hypothetical protein
MSGQAMPVYDLGQSLPLAPVWVAGEVRRWHANPALARSGQDNANHQGRCVQLLFLLNPTASPALIRAVAFHDVGEVFAGDLSAPFKRAHPAVAQAHAMIETTARERLCGAEPWLTDEERAWLRLVRVAAIYGCTLPEVERRAERLGIAGQRPHRRTPVYSVPAFRQLWLDPSLSLAEIGARLGMVKRSVSIHARRLGLGPRQTGRRATVVFDALFDRMWLDDVTTGAMAAHYGCSRSNIGHEARRRGLPGRARTMPGRKTLAQFQEAQLGRAMARHAKIEQDALRLSEMVDGFAQRVRAA